MSGKLMKLRELRNKKGLTYDDVGNYLGFKGGSYYRKMENGERDIKLNVLLKLAELYNVSLAYLLGADDREIILPENSVPVNPDGIKLIPVYGSIAAGMPITAVEERGQYMPFDTNLAKIDKRDVKDYFYLRVKGDSMEPNIIEGDVVLVRRQSIVDNGQIAVVICNREDATCKRVTIAGEKLVLQSDNPKYKPMVLNASDCFIIGKVISHTRKD